MPRSRRRKSSPAKPKQRPKLRRRRPLQRPRLRKKKRPRGRSVRSPLQAILRKSLSDAATIVVVGIGNELRGDDVAGLLVARALKGARSRKLVAIEGGPAPENVTGQIIRAKPSHVVLVDSAWMKTKPGAVRIIAHDRIGGTSFSTHTLPANVLVTYLEQSTGCRVVTIGIQPKQTEFGSAMTPAVQASVDQVVEALLNAASS